MERRGMVLYRLGIVHILQLATQLATLTYATYVHFKETGKAR